ncbi:hypothetical protein GCM10023196_062540 [Actinoallomurus vinaceus]|uniref:Uncharacterized protein n=1 Tax=Actinoallomurus vinaceus TaxID=1080074 RepID=A0ABP8ULB0_9ACTN
MKNDVQQLKDLIAPHDPAARVRVDPVEMFTTSRAIVDGATRPAPAAERHRSPRRRWLVGVPAIAVAAVLALAAVRPGHIGPVRIGPAEAQALAFTRHGDFVDVRIIDPNADPQRYRREFAAHHMDVDLQMRSASPSLAGTMISVDDGSRTGTSKITEIDGARGCGNMWCKAGVRIPVGMRGRVTVIFGRAARPGEPYALAGDPTAWGEALQGLSLRNHAVADVRRMAGQRHVTIQRYFGEAPWKRPGVEPPRNFAGWSYDEHVLEAARVPDGWYVHDAFTGRFPNTVELVVAPWPDRGR